MDRRTDTSTLLIQKRDEILSLAERRGASNVRVFGSVARDEARADSDVEFLVDLDPDRSLLDVGGLAMDLSPPRSPGRCCDRSGAPGAYPLPGRT